jgi:hypothetical protein
MNSFLKEITSKENWEKAYHLNALKDRERSGRSEKIEWIPFLLSLLIYISLVAVIWVIISPIINYIKMRASG